MSVPYDILEEDMTVAQEIALNEKLKRTGKEMARKLRAKRMGFSCNIVVTSIMLGELMLIEDAPPKAQDEITAIFLKALKTALGRGDE